MAGGAQQFCLKWNNYHVNIASSFDSLRIDEDFVDVTLACSGCQLKAHRMVLSACSPFFRQLLKSNPHPHPIVILRDVSQYNMELLLDFMYHGEVNVAQEQLPEFLKVAELLKVKGLADEKREEAARAGPNGQSTGVRTPSSSPAPAPPLIQPTAPPADESPPPPPVKRHRPMPLPALLQHPPPPAPLPAAAPTAPPPPPPGMGYVDPAAVKREPPDSETAEYGTPESLRPGGVSEDRVRVLQQTSLSAEEAALLVPAEVAMEEAEQPLPPEASRGQPAGPGPSTVPHEASTDPLMRLLAAADQQAGTGITLPSGVTLSALGAAPGAPRPPGPPQGPLQGQQGLQAERRSFPCFICGKEFGYPHHMRRHVETVHTLYPSYVFCPECGRVYKNKNSLSVHMSMYHNSQRRAAQREQALQAQAAAQAQAQAAAGAWQAETAAMTAARQPWPAE